MYLSLACAVPDAQSPVNGTPVRANPNARGSAVAGARFLMGLGGGPGGTIDNARLDMNQC